MTQQTTRRQRKLVARPARKYPRRIAAFFKRLQDSYTAGNPPGTFSRPPVRQQHAIAIQQLNATLLPPLLWARLKRASAARGNRTRPAWRVVLRERNTTPSEYAVGVRALSGFECSAQRISESW